MGQALMKQKELRQPISIYCEQCKGDTPHTWPASSGSGVVARCLFCDTALYADSIDDMKNYISAHRRK